MNKFTILTGIAAAVVASSAVAQWNRLSPTTVPGARSLAAMGYDAARQQIVLFGGSGGFSYNNDTWVYDGRDWAMRSPTTSPAGRSECLMASDGASMLLYGGNTGGGGPWGGPASDETWRWNGQDWSMVSTLNSPGGLARYAAAYDTGRGRLVIYGGVSNTSNLWAETGTWEFDGTNWAQVTTTVDPGPREHPAMCYDPVNRRTILFGGIDPQVGGFADTWAFDGTAWTRLTTNGTPGQRTLAPMVYDAARGVCVLQGGMDPTNGQPISDTWEFDGTNWTMVAGATQVPADHIMFSMAYDSTRRNVVLFGGVDSFFGAYNETWEYGASFHPYGSGCSGSLASPTISNVTGPVIGSAFQIDMGGLDPASSAAFMIFGFSSSSTDLSSLGMTGCTLHASSNLIFGLSASGGTASWSLTVPNSAALMGAKFYSQGMAQDATANALGLVLSEGAESVIGV